jgi:signal transduction histidine kinase
LSRYREMSNALHIAWWESNAKTGLFTFSDYFCSLVGIETNTMTFPEVLNLIRKDYRDLITQESYEFSGQRHEFFNRKLPIITPKGEVWINAHFLYHISTEECDGGFGVVNLLSPEEIESENKVTDLSKELMRQIDKISITLTNFLKESNENLIIDNILQSILEYYDADNAYMFEYDATKNWQICAHEAVKEGNSIHIKDFCHHFNCATRMPGVTRIIQSGKPLVVDDADNTELLMKEDIESFKEFGIKSMIALPIRSGNHDVIGDIGIDYLNSTHHWSSTDFLWLNAMCNILSICLDLKQEKKTSAADRQYYEGLIKNMPIGYGLLGLDFDDDGNVSDYRILGANKAGYDMHGFNATHSGEECTQLYDKDYARKKLAFLQKVYYDYKYKESDETLPSGKHCHMITYVAEGNNIVELYIDTTKMLEAQNSALRSERLFHSIFTHIPVGEAIYDISGTMTDVNEEYLRIFGINGLINDKGYSLLDDVNCTDNIRDLFNESDEQSFSFSIVYNFDILNNYKSSRTGKANINFKVLKLYDDDGRLTSYLLICVEDTDKLIAMNKVRDFENYFSMISDYAKIGYANFNLLSKEGYAIKQWYKNMGEEPDSPLNSIVEVYSHMHPDDRKAILEFIDKAKKGQEKDFTKELRIRRPGTEDQWNWIYKKIVVADYSPDRGLIEINGVNYDITEFKESQLELIEARDKAMEADRLKSSFLANMSHEIRTPLNAIVGFSDLLAQSNNPDEKEQYINIIKENNELLLQLINDILDISKLEAGMIEFNYSDVDINEFCEDIVKSMRLKVTNDVKIIFEPTTMRCTLKTDRNRLYQLVANLINNSIKFTPSGSITLAYHWVDDNNIRFSVTDTGIGIDEDKKDMVSQRFVKLNSFAQGTGLGLSICKTIVNQMGGSIGVESKKGVGSCFWFILPGDESKCVMEASAPTETMQSSATFNSGMSEGQVRNEKPLILVAEDEYNNYFLLEAILKKDYRIVRAVDGLDAVDKYGKLHPDLILMDIQMPNMNGLDATMRIRETDKSTPILAVTAFAFEVDKDNALAAGCNGFIAKPINMVKLKETIAEHLK